MIKVGLQQTDGCEKKFTDRSDKAAVNEYIGL